VDFELPEHLKALQRTIRDYLEREVPRSRIRELDEQARFPYEEWEGIARLGLIGAPFPEEYGGAGGNILDEVVITEELARGFTALSFAYLVTVSFGGMSILWFGNEEQRRKYLPPMCAGQARYALALTEPGGGTDILGALRTSAVRDGDDFVLNGQKVYITGASVANALIVVARTGPPVRKKGEGLTLFLVDLPAKGMEIRPMHKLGLRAVASCEVFLNDVRVPATAVLGQEGQGWYHIIQSLNNERIEIAALCLGIAQAALDDAVAYALERRAFGKPIGQFQAIQHMLADSFVEVELARMAVYRAAWLQSQGRPVAADAALAKLVASETAMRVTDRGMEILAGVGYMMETDMQRYWRDARLFTFAPISNEMVRNFLGEHLGLPRSY